MCDIWWHMMTYDDIWWHIMTYDDIWWHMMTYDDISCVTRDACAQSECKLLLSVTRKSRFGLLPYAYVCHGSFMCVTYDLFTRVCHGSFMCVTCHGSFMCVTCHGSFMCVTNDWFTGVFHGSFFCVTNDLFTCGCHGSFICVTDDLFACDCWMNHIWLIHITYSHLTYSRVYAMAHSFVSHTTQAHVTHEWIINNLFTHDLFAFDLLTCVCHGSFICVTYDVFTHVTNMSVTEGSICFWIYKHLFICDSTLRRSHIWKHRWIISYVTQRNDAVISESTGE